MSLNTILPGFIFSIIGIWLFGRAKKSLNYCHLFISMTLMIYTFFTPDAAWDWGVGIILCFAAWYFY